MPNKNVEEVLPLHEPNEDAAENEEADEKNFIEKYKDRIKQTITITAISIAVASIVMGGYAMHSLRENIVYAGAVLGIIVASTVIVKQMIIQYLDTLRTVHNRIRDEINRFMEENNELHYIVNDLQVQTGRLQPIEAAFSKTTSDMQTSTDELKQAVEQNQKYIAEINHLVQAEFQEELLKSILKADRSGDLKITQKEVRVLMSRFRGKQLNIDENLLMRTLEENDGSVASVVALIRNKTLYLEVGES